MKHIHKMDMDRLDESEEYLHQTISSHFKIIFNYFESLQNLTVYQNLNLDYLESSLRSFIMRPSTSIFLIALIILLFFSHTANFWLNIFFNRFPFKLITRHFIGTSFNNGNLKNVIYELKANQVGIYAIQGRRPHMEDNFSFKFDTFNGECLLNGRRLENLKQSKNISQTYNLEIIGIFDGHGGKTASDFAHKNLVDLVKQSFDELIINNHLNQCKEPNSETISKMLTEQILKLDSILCDRLKNSGDIAGTTALLALRIVNSNELIIANIGDSRGVLCDYKGNTIALSFDHKPNHPNEYKRIYENGGFVKFNGVWRVAGILACSRALGDFPLKEKNYVIAKPDILTFKLDELRPKFAILASDGLFDFFSNEAAVKFVKDKMEELLSSKHLLSKNELSLELAKKLTLEAYHRGSTDNITVAVWIFDYNIIDKRTISNSTSSFTPVKEVKIRTRKANELEEMEVKHNHRSKVEKKIIVENKFAKDIIYETKALICSNEPIEFKVSENLINLNDENELDKTREDESKLKIKKCKKEEKKSKKFNLLNLELNLKLSPDKDTKSMNNLDNKDDRKLKDNLNKIKNDIKLKDGLNKDTYCTENNENDENDKKIHQNEDIDKNANLSYEVRLKDEYNLVRSPKKLKNVKPDQQTDEFFDCK